MAPGANIRRLEIVPVPGTSVLALLAGTDTGVFLTQTQKLGGVGGARDDLSDNLDTIVTDVTASADLSVSLWTMRSSITTGAGLPERLVAVLSSQMSAAVSTFVDSVSVLFPGFGSGVDDVTVAASTSTVPSGTAGSTSTVI